MINDKSKLCKSCNRSFKYYFYSEEKQKTIYLSRVYCYDCNPSGKRPKRLEDFIIVNGVQCKRCIYCNQSKSLDEFHMNESRSKRRDSGCSECRNRQKSEKRYELKLRCLRHLGHKCVDCQLSNAHPAIYDFHHEGGKDFSIGNELSCGHNHEKAFVKLLPELNKCVVLCSNCHRLRHARSFVSKKPSIGDNLKTMTAI